MQFIKKHPYRFLMILLLLAAAVLLPERWHSKSSEPQTRVIKLVAHKYGYSPGRIRVNKGDTIVIKPTSKDVTHGFYLDGYTVEFIIKQGGVAFQKYDWEDDDGKIHTDWDKVREIEFTADKAGKFIFRCTQVCGNLHPFMTGELIVAPNTLHHTMTALSVWVVLSLFIAFYKKAPEKIRHRPHGTPGTDTAAGPLAAVKNDAGSDAAQSKRRWINLFEVVPGLKWLFKRRSFQFFLIFPGFVVFYLFIIASAFGSPVGNRNVAIIIVWILWWFLLKSVFVPLGGRLWCMICPLPGPGEWISRKAFTAVRFFKKPLKGKHHRYTGLGLDWPKPLRNMWLQNVIFLAMISFGIILITRPVATALLFLLILVVILVFAFIFRNRVFCLYLCPVGGFLGNYSMASMTALRAVDKDVCKKHKNKNCLCGSSEGWGCPWNQYTGTMDRNNHCGLCTECVKTCPKDNVGFFLRPFGEDRKIKDTSEMFNIIIMLVVCIAFSITMLGPWSTVKAAANVTESKNIPAFLTYIGVLYSAALIIFPGLFWLVTKGAMRMAGIRGETKPFAVLMSYLLIPIGIFSWIAFSLPSVMVNWSYIANVLSDPLGWGWDIFGTAHAHFNPFFPDLVPLIQGLLLLTGLYFGIHRCNLALSSVVPDAHRRMKAMILPSVFAFAVIQIFFRLYLG